MPQQLDPETLRSLLQSENIEELTVSDLKSLFRSEKSMLDFLPDGFYRLDPRDDTPVIFHSSRAQRPRDNRPLPEDPLNRDMVCAICQGNTTGIIDVAKLSEGYTFINENLYPNHFPFEEEMLTVKDASHGETVEPVDQDTFGMHFVQWTSSVHRQDWHNMPVLDATIVMQRLAALEEKLITESTSRAQQDKDINGSPEQGTHVLIFKNFGRLVGGSLAHGHQQIVSSNVMPRRMADNWHFYQKRGELFSSYMQRVTPANLLVKDYGPAVLLVPFFMRRPYDVMLLVKDGSRQYLHQLSDLEIGAVAEGWCDTIGVIRQIMPKIGREIAYSVLVHNGPGAGLYFEFLPYTQESGGLENLGLFVCQANPSDVAKHIRETL